MTGGEFLEGLRVGCLGFVGHWLAVVWRSLEVLSGEA